MEVVPVRVGLLVDKIQGSHYEVQPGSRKCLIFKPPRSGGDASKYKEIYLDHIQVVEESSDLLVRECKMDEQLNGALQGYNSAIYTVNTRDPSSRSNGLLLLALKRLQALAAQDRIPRRYSFILLGLTDGRCINCANEKTLQHSLVRDDLDSLYEEAASLQVIVDRLESAFSLPYVLLLKIEVDDTAAIVGPPASLPPPSKLCFADLGWSHPPLGGTFTGPILTQSLEQLKNMAQQLYQLPVDTAIDTDVCFLTTLSADFLGGNSRTLWILRASLDDANAQGVVKFGELLRKLKHKVHRNRRGWGAGGAPVRALRAADEALQRTQVDLEQLTYAHRQVEAQLAGERAARARAEADAAAARGERDALAAQADAAHAARDAARGETRAARAELVDARLAAQTAALDVVDAQEHVRALRAEVVHVTVERDKGYLSTRLVENRLDALTQQLHAAAEEARFLAVQRTELLREIERAAAARNALAFHHNAVLAEHQELVAKYQSTTDAYRELATKHHATRDALRNMNATLDQMEATHGEAQGAWMRKEADLQEALEQAKSDREVVLGECARLAARHDELEREASAATKRAEKAEALAMETRETLTEALTEARSQAHAAHAALDDVRAACTNKEVELAKAADEFRAAKNRAQTELDAARGEVRVLRLQKMELEATVERHRRLAEKHVSEQLTLEEGLRNRLAEANRRLSEEFAAAKNSAIAQRRDPEQDAAVANLRKREQDLLVEVDQTAAALRKLEFERDSLNTDVVRLQSRSNELAKQLEELETLTQQERSAWRAREAELEDDIRKQRRRQAQVQVADQELRTAQAAWLATKEELEEALATARRTAKEASADNARAAAEHDRLLHEAEEERARLTNQAVKAEEELRSLNKQVALLKKNLEQERNRVEELEVQHRTTFKTADFSKQSLEREVSEFKLKVQQLEDEREALAAEVAEVRKTVQKLRKDLTQAQSKARVAEEAAAEAASMVEELEASGASSSNVAGAMKEATERLRKDNKELRAKVHGLTADLDRASAQAAESEASDAVHAKEVLLMRKNLSEREAQLRDLKKELSETRTTAAEAMRLAEISQAKLAAAAQSRVVEDRVPAGPPEQPVPVREEAPPVSSQPIEQSASPLHAESRPDRAGPEPARKRQPAAKSKAATATAKPAATKAKARPEKKEVSTKPVEAEQDDRPKDDFVAPRGRPPRRAAAGARHVGRIDNMSDESGESGDESEDAPRKKAHTANDRAVNQSRPSNAERMLAATRAGVIIPRADLSVEVLETPSKIGELPIHAGPLDELPSNAAPAAEGSQDKATAARGKGGRRRKAAEATEDQEAAVKDARRAAGKRKAAAAASKVETSASQEQPSQENALRAVAAQLQEENGPASSQELLSNSSGSLAGVRKKRRIGKPAAAALKVVQTPALERTGRLDKALEFMQKPFVSSSLRERLQVAAGTDH